MVRQMHENSLLNEENCTLRAINAFLKAENKALKAELAALKETKITEPSSNTTLAINARNESDAKLFSDIRTLPDEKPSEAPTLPSETGLRPEDEDVNGEYRQILAGIRAAVMTGNVEELGRLLLTDMGKACIHEKDTIGLTPLHHAAGQSKFEAVKLLVELGADVNAKAKSGATPLHHAASMSRFGAIKFLVEMGAVVDHVSTGLGTPLATAALYGCESIAQYLLSKGASKEKAINTSGFDKDLVKGFFADFERIIQNRSEFKTKRDELEALMLKAEKPENLPTTTKGITIAGLKKMKALIQSECETGRFKEDQGFTDGTQCKGTMKYEELTTTDIVYRYVKDESVSGNLRLIDIPGFVAPEHKVLPTFFISHAWKGRFSVLLDKIFTYAEDHCLSDETAVWIDVFSVNQHGSKDCSEFSQAQNWADVAAFKNVVQTCTGGTLVVCDFELCVTYSRAWCLVSLIDLPSKKYKISLVDTMMRNSL